jgi:DNA-binding CsgD family transcriptional regulator
MNSGSGALPQPVTEIDLHMTEAAALAATLERLAGGVFLVGPDVQIIFANATGRAMLVEGRFLSEVQGALAAVDPQADRRLRDALAAAGGDATSGAKAVLLTASAAERWIAHVLPLGSSVRGQTAIAHSAVAALLVREASLDSLLATQTVAEVFGLTASELRVLRAVLEVGGVRAITKVLGISEATVRTHLHHVFQKTGARRQVDLAKLVAGAASPFHD